VRVFFFSTIWRYSALFVCALLSAATLLLCIFVANSYRGNLENQFRRETANIAKLLIGHFDATVISTDELLLHIASDYLSIEGDRLATPLQLHNLLKGHAFQRSTSIVLLSIVDKRGMMIATSTLYPFTPLDAVNKKYFTFHANNPLHSQLYIGTPEIGRVSQKWIVPISRPLKNKDGAFDGVVTASYMVSDFLQLFENLNIKDVGLASFVGRDGVALVRSVNGRLSYGEKIPGQSVIFNKVLSGEKQGSFDALSAFDQKRRIGYFTTSEVAPFHAYVGYDYSYITSEYNGALVLLGSIWILFSAVLLGAFLFVQKIATLHQESRLAAIESIVAERRRILSDMHDSIGASLAVLISHLNPSGGDWIQLKRKATQILTELRLLVDSVGGQDTDINAVLASVRHRMQSGLEFAGIKVIWRVDQPPIILALTSQDALSLRLIIMEALSNVMHHSHANAVTLSATFDKAARLLAITVADDGCGFDAATSAEGAGLKNMQSRAKKLTWPTMIHIESAPGKGTAVQIKIELPADVKITD